MNTKSTVIYGTGVSTGIAIGRLSFFSRKDLGIHKRLVSSVESELARFGKAKALAAIQLGELAVSTAEKLGKEHSLLFEIHQMMLDDLDYQESVTSIIRSEHCCAEYAVSRTAKQLSEMFSNMEDTYMRARAADVQDVSRRVIEILIDKQNISAISNEAQILASDDFSPSETAQFDRESVLALVTSEGSANSHTAIFARVLGIPAIIKANKLLDKVNEGAIVIVDGDAGLVYINPDDTKLEEYRQKQQICIQEKELLQQLRDSDTVTKSGRKICLCANIGSDADVEHAVLHGAEGIGLFRSEFLYLEQNDYPDEERQFVAYKNVAAAMNPRPVIVRTLDIGADKQAACFGLPDEENPALGLRAIRICLEKPDVFQTQLRAILRASHYGNISIMLPMIASEWEVELAKKALDTAKKDLDERNKPYDKNIKLGIMIETPAAAVISDKLAQMVDFFSLGTNDLTQYSLAVDRQNSSLDRFYDPHHESIKRLIQWVCENAHKHNIEVGVCGELASDIDMTDFFLETGIDKLSMPASSILKLRKTIIDHD